MSIQELIKNPIVLAVLATLLTYGYLYWSNLEKQKKYPKAKLEPISIVTPLIVGLLVFIVAYNLFEKPSGNIQQTAQMQWQPNTKPICDQPSAKMQCNTAINKMKFTEGADSATYHLVGKNAIRLPQADVFIDLARF
jgi:hypothetical protein